MLWIAATLFALAVHTPALAGDGKLVLRVVDRETGQPLACRIHLQNAAKRPQKALKTPFWHDHFVFDGEVTLKLPKGNYSFEMERGLEYLTRSGHFTIDDFADDSKTIDLQRYVNMADEGWWSGDMSVERPVKDVPLLMEADDLHVAPLVTWRSQKTTWPSSTGTNNTAPKDLLVETSGRRFHHLLGQADARGGNSVLLLNLSEMIDMSAATAELPPALDYIAQARRQSGAWIDVDKAFSWDLPIWIAHGQVDSIEIANSHLGRTSVIANEAGGKPRDKTRFPGASGIGRWSEAIYYHLLNCGLRIPPSAGSGSGVAPNPVGYNRVYVHVDGDFTYQRWWEGFRAGQVLVTNGPLIRPTVEGELPGHEFRAAAGEQLDLEIGLTLSTRDKVAYLEIVKDGRVAHDIRLDDWAKAGGKLPKVHFDASGWFLLRAVGENQQTYRFASTGPYYVQIGPEPRISKTSAQFFLDWVTELAERLKLVDAGEREPRTAQLGRAEQFWQDLVNRANAE